MYKRQKLTDVTGPSDDEPVAADKMPDGSKPKKGNWGWPKWGKPSMPRASFPSFGWPAGMKLPEGTQSADGTPLDGAQPQEDGSVLLPDGVTSIPASDVVLPDGTKLTDVTVPSDDEPVAVDKMPDGSTPRKGGGWGWPKWGKPSMPALAAGSVAAAAPSAPAHVAADKDPSTSTSATRLDDFRVSLPYGTLLLPCSTIMLPNGTTIPEGETIPADTVLDDGTKLSASAVRVPSNGTVLVPAGSTLADGSVLSEGAICLPDHTYLLPNGTTLPEDATIPHNTTLPDGAPVPDDAIQLANGTILLPAGTIFADGHLVESSPAVEQPSVAIEAASAPESTAPPDSTSDVATEAPKKPNPMDLFDQLYNENLERLQQEPQASVPRDANHAPDSASADSKSIGWGWGFGWLRGKSQASSPKAVVASAPSEGPGASPVDAPPSADESNGFFGSVCLLYTSPSPRD